MITVNERLYGSIFVRLFSIVDSTSLTYNNNIQYGS
jgi:hypothetical protein